MAIKHNEQMMYNFKHRSMEDFFFSDEWQRLMAEGDGGASGFGISGEDDTAEEDRIFNMDDHIFKIQTDAGNGINIRAVDGVNDNNIYLVTKKNTNANSFASVNLRSNKNLIDNDVTSIELYATHDDNIAYSLFTMNGFGTSIDAPLITLDGDIVKILNILPFADDAAAATGGIPVGGLYRTASALKIRVA